MSFLDEVAARLVAAGAGTLTTTAPSAIFMGPRPVIPQGNGPFISIAETGGTGAMRTQRTGYQRPSAQIVCRATTRSVARSKAKAVYDALGGENGLHNATLGGTFYLSIVATQEPFDMLPDEQNRPRVAFNVEAVKVPS